jgi:protein-tyrosine phosphatase
MIDLHCHLLPAVDDGARTLGDALALARAAVASGITGAVVTPHVYPGVWDNDESIIGPVLQRLREALAAEGIGLQLVLGAEIRLHPDTLPLVGERRLPMLGRFEDSDVALIEFPDGAIPPGALQACESLVAQGVRPMLAHPERNKAVMRDPSRVVAFLDAGCLVQVTAASVIGEFGEPALAAAHELLARGMVTVVATDAHNLHARPPRLREARDALGRLYGQGVAHRLVDETPRRIVSGRADWVAGEGVVHSGAEAA